MRYSVHLIVRCYWRRVWAHLCYQRRPRSFLWWRAHHPSPIMRRAGRQKKWFATTFLGTKTQFGYLTIPKFPKSILCEILWSKSIFHQNAMHVNLSVICPHLLKNCKKSCVKIFWLKLRQTILLHQNAMPVCLSLWLAFALSLPHLLKSQKELCGNLLVKIKTKNPSVCLSAWHLRFYTLTTGVKPSQLCNVHNLENYNQYWFWFLCCGQKATCNLNLCSIIWQMLIMVW